jgi:hypothetical protein
LLPPKGRLPLPLPARRLQPSCANSRESRPARCVLSYKQSQACPHNHVAEGCAAGRAIDQHIDRIRSGAMAGSCMTQVLTTRSVGKYAVGTNTSRKVLSINLVFATPYSYLVRPNRGKEHNSILEDLAGRSRDEKKRGVVEKAGRQGKKKGKGGALQVRLEDCVW